MTKRMIIMLAIVGVVFGLVFGFQLFKAKMIKKYITAGSNPPQTVSTIKASKEVWQPHIEAVGTVSAWRGADLSPQVAGTVAHLFFESGQEVKAGTILAELEDADDRAKLASLKATADLDRIVYERDQQQLAAQAISQATLDTDSGNLKQARANVDQQQATLAYKTLRAPFSGRLGIRQVDIGQYLAVGTVVVTLQTLDPIYVDFLLPQQDLDRVRVGQPVVARSDSFPKDQFPGTVQAINPKVDTSTRNVQVRATFANPSEKLLPGMYATVAIDSGEAAAFITLPQTAIAYNPFGDTVFLVDHQRDPAGHPVLIARQQFISVGASRGDQIEVLTGVKEGDEVVSAGQLKLHNGSPLIINNSIPMSNEANPAARDE